MPSHAATLDALAVLSPNGTTRNGGRSSGLVTYHYPRTQPKSEVYEVFVDGKRVDVLRAGKADFAAFECSGSVDITVVLRKSAAGAVVRPVHRGIEVQIEKNTIRFHLDRPQYLCLQTVGNVELFLYANAPEVDRPRPDEPHVHYFAAGQIYEVGVMELHSGETLYIEAGAIVRGAIVARQASDIVIRGRGILDGSYHNYEQGDRVRMITLDHCTRVVVADIIMIEPTTWMLVVGRSEYVQIRHVKQIGSVMSSDGVDVCGSRHVRVEDCCLRNDDDNVAIKALAPRDGPNWEGDVEDVRVRRCLFWNGQPGNSMEIGYELRADRVSDIVFEEIDVLAVHGDGAAISIHNGDRAMVENVRWENIRIEHYWSRLIDFRVVLSEYSKDPVRGYIRNIVLKNIRVLKSINNSSYSVSLISGFDASKPVENVVIEDLYLNEEKVVNGDQLDLHSRNVVDLVFR